MYLKLVVFAICLTSVFAFPFGAPSEACGPMIPNHGQQLGFPLPLRVTFSTNTVPAGGLVTVRFEGNQNDPMFGNFTFRGFMGQMRVADDRRVGFFERGPDAHHVDCPEFYPESTITHMNHNDRTVAEFNWRAPANVGVVPYTVRCFFTIVMNVGIYWANQVSEPITVNPH